MNIASICCIAFVDWVWNPDFYPFFDREEWRVEVWILSSNGELKRTMRSELHRTKHHQDDSHEKVVNQSGEVVKSELIAQGWKPIEGHYWCLVRETSPSGANGKDPTELLHTLNEANQRRLIPLGSSVAYSHLGRALESLIEANRSTASGSRVQDIADQLAKLTKLYQDKAITKEEYEAAKRKLLG